MLATLRDRIREDAAEAKRDVRRRACGRWVPYRDLQTGEIKWKPFFCGDFRECARCRKARAVTLQNRFERVKGNGVVGVWLPKRERKMLHRVGKKNYWFMPVGDKDLVVIRKEYRHFIGGTSFPLDFDENDWFELAATPKGRNQSGALGNLAPKEKDVEVVVTAPSPVVEGLSAREICDALNEASAKTAHLEPADAEEALDAHKRWAKAYAEAAEARGGLVVCWVPLQIAYETFCIESKNIREVSPEDLPEEVLETLGEG